ncbi:transcription antitermination factor NusB [Oscillospiraceae bacterium OttesenSCG-928-G22]|nr:transcription antitermination factor NusB [Oscillospiraceae bacterium OttesenSCG-928-G22]
MKRTTARELAVRLVYRLEYTGESAQELLEDGLSTEHFASLVEEDELYGEPINKKQAAYITAVVTGVAESRDALDADIRKYSATWKTERMSKILLAILRVALFEIEHVEDAPENAAINAAVDLAKAYLDEEGASFVNGVLGAYSRARQGKK